MGALKGYFPEAIHKKSEGQHAAKLLQPVRVIFYWEKQSAKQDLRKHYCIGNRRYWGFILHYAAYYKPDPHKNAQAKEWEDQHFKESSHAVHQCEPEYEIAESNHNYKADDMKKQPAYHFPGNNGAAPYRRSP